MPIQFLKLTMNKLLLRVAKEKKTTVVAGHAAQVAKMEQETTKTTSAPAPAAAKQAEQASAKELKIEVHATAVHHEKVAPIVAHAQSHEISHNQAVNQLDFCTTYYCRHTLVIDRYT